MTISTHVLDASLGTPASGVSVTLSRLEGGWLDVESGVTGPYFAARAVPAFYPEVAITFTIPAPDDSAGGNAGHFHVPLLLSPFAYSTYRGS
jgi:5-hydroxyisourate hydrolase